VSRLISIRFQLSQAPDACCFVSATVREDLIDHPARLAVVSDVCGRSNPPWLELLSN
jgi:hypothetical protein